MVVVACTPAPSKEEEEAAKNTWACTAAGERIVIRFDVGEARLLMPDGNRVFLYQIPTTSGVRFSNGQIELQGKGMDLELVIVPFRTDEDGTEVMTYAFRPIQGD